MDFDDTPEQAAFRAQVRGWLSEHAAEAPPEFAGDVSQEKRIPKFEGR